MIKKSDKKRGQKNGQKIENIPEGKAMHGKILVSWW